MKELEHFAGKIYTLAECPKYIKHKEIRGVRTGAWGVHTPKDQEKMAKDRRE